MDGWDGMGWMDGMDRMDGQITSWLFAWFVGGRVCRSGVWLIYLLTVYLVVKLFGYLVDGLIGWMIG